MGILVAHSSVSAQETMLLPLAVADNQYSVVLNDEFLSRASASFTGRFQPLYSRCLSECWQKMSVPPRYSTSQMWCVTITLHPLYTGGKGETRTLAPKNRPNRLAICPLHQLEYFSRYPIVSSDCQDWFSQSPFPRKRAAIVVRVRGFEPPMEITRQIKSLLPSSTRRHPYMQREFQPPCLDGVEPPSRLDSNQAFTLSGHPVPT